MAILKVNVKTEGQIDNTAIYLEDPLESIPIRLKPKSAGEWERDNISVPIEGDLDYSLAVIAFSGTKFDCVITNTEDDTTIEFSGITGKKIKNYYHEKDTKKFK